MKRVRLGSRNSGIVGTIFLLSAPVSAQYTQRVSLTSGGAQGNAGSVYPAMSSSSADGRYIAFTSLATNLVPGDTNGVQDVFVRDRQLGITERVSVNSAGVQANGTSFQSSISADGRYVAFYTLATNLDVADTNGTYDVYVRDRQLGTTERVSVSSSGTQGDAYSVGGALSTDGRYVCFDSIATNLVAGDTNGSSDVFIRDRLLGTTELVSVDSSGVEGNGFSARGAITADGRYVVFASEATNLVAGDTNAASDTFVHDRQTGTTERVSVDSSGTEAIGGTANVWTPSITDDGRYVTFTTDATNLVPGDTNGVHDVFIRDRQLGTTERVSVDSSGVEGNGDCRSNSVSADGRYVAFDSSATNLVAGDTNGWPDVFLRDRQLGTTERVSISSGAGQGNFDSDSAVVSADGRYVVFESFASTLVGGDTNGASDVFIRDRNVTSFTSLCDPGIDGVHSCPCGNSPSGLGRGCDNSASTGGASLSATGISYLSVDSLTFTTSGEKPTATSILLQGTLLNAGGITYGQGVRCFGGTLKRLFTKHAVAGSITAPDFGAGDPTVSARSAAKGNPISAGQSRWYLVFYRDPTVLGGCPAASTFNATQTGRIDWSL